jgi:hypothetical protein
MSFIRTKKIKGAEYAYIVENRWRWKKTKQKAKKYLGRVYRHSKVNVKDFCVYYSIGNLDGYVESSGKDEMIESLVELELHNHGFSLEDGIWSRDGCFVNLKERKVYNNRENDIALAFNEGYLTSYALRKLFCFEAECEEDGYDLAKMFVESGINVPKEIFIGIFGKVFK